MDSYYPISRADYLKWLLWASVLKHPDPLIGLYEFVLVRDRLLLGLPTTQTLLTLILSEVDVHILSGICEWTPRNTYSRHQYTLFFSAFEKWGDRYRELVADVLDIFGLKGNWIHPKPRSQTCHS